MNRLTNICVFLAIFIFTSDRLAAQVGIKSDNTQPDASAMLEVKSPDRGFLPPRMTFAELSAITAPAAGLMVYCTDCGMNHTGAMTIFMNGLWFTLEAGCNAPAAPSAGIHLPAETQVTWNWNAVPGVAGYKWNTVNNYNTAADIGNVTTKTETGLTCNTPYTRYLWAYSPCGASVAATLTQTTTACASPGVPCPGTPSVTYGGKTYNTVLIGSQCWLGKNLDIGTRINGSAEQSNNQVIEKYCYNDLDANCEVYGGLYQWEEMLNYTGSQDGQGICPTGWHIPSDFAWSTLASFLGGEGVAGGDLKETGTTHWADPNTGATNLTGFTGLPAGERVDVTSFINLTASTTFWSSNTDVLTWGLYRSLYNYTNHLYRYSSLKSSGFSVRCLKN